MHEFGPNGFNYKETYLKDWVQLDVHGYSGWHSSNLRYGANPLLTLPVNSQRAARMADKIERYLATRQTKIDQVVDEWLLKPDADKMENARGLPDGNYIFFPLQKPHDETQLFTRFEPPEIVEKLLPWCRARGFKLLLKRHPHCGSPLVTAWLEKMQQTDDVIVTAGDIYEILPKSKIVTTVSSSVGFEALLRNIPVVTFGNSEYGKLTDEIFDLSNLPTVMDQLLQSPPDRRSALYDYMSSNLFDSSDEQDIRDCYNMLRDIALSSGMNVGRKQVHDLPAHIDFREVGNGKNYTLHGFTYPFTHGTHTNDRKATIIFNYPGSALETQRIVIACRANVSPAKKLMIFDIYCNDHKVNPDFIIIDESNSEPVFFIDVLLCPGVNTITFDLHIPSRPADTGDSFDVRLLGLDMWYMKFAQ